MDYDSSHIAVYQYFADQIRGTPESLHWSRQLPEDICKPAAIRQLIENGDLELTSREGEGCPMYKLTIQGEETGARSIQEGQVVLR